MLSVAALLVLWLLDWYVTRVTVGPIAAVPMFFLAYRLPRALAYGAAAVFAIAFAMADADLRVAEPDDARVILSALALFACYAIVVWSSQRFVSYRRSVDALRRALVRRERVADTDFVTGIYNRLFFERALLAKLGSASGESFGIVFVDLDGFKNINDRFGHLAGDAILRSVAERFAGAIGSRGIVSRIGGDEFALLIDASQSAGDLAVIEGDLQRSLDAPLAFAATEVSVAASFGSSLFPADGDSRAALLSAADSRMYEGKRARRLGVVGKV